MIAAAPSRRRNRKLGHVPIRQVSINDIRPSPENEELYRPVDPTDPEIVAMADSIREHGVREPLVITLDGYILSGHRRYTAARVAGLKTVPVRVENVRRLVKVRMSGHGDVSKEFVQLLREFNRQRVKTFDEKLREEVVSADPEVAYQSLIEHRQERSRVDLETLDIRREKRRAEISRAKWPFLDAIKKSIEERRDFWPLSDRQIHYPLLNCPPLIHASKPDSRYRNNLQSYKALCELLTRARLTGDIPMHVIQDATRPVTLWDIHQDVQGYLREQVKDFGTGYWRDLMQSQPNHIEIIGEKNTVAPIIGLLCEVLQSIGLKWFPPVSAQSNTRASIATAARPARGSRLRIGRQQQRRNQA
jgi:hypothetical protein